MPTVANSFLLIAVTLLGSMPLQSRTNPALSDNFATLAAKADAARGAERLDEAATLYKKALALRPRWAEGWWSLGTIAYDRDSYGEAASAFEKVIALAPRNGTAYVMLGLSEFELGRDDLSLRHIEKGAKLGLDKDPSLRQVALYHQGVVQQRQGKFQAARETLDQLCKQEMKSEGLASTMGMVLLRMRSKMPPLPGSPDAAVVSAVGQAGCMAGQKKFDDARKAMSAVVAQYPKYPAIHYAFGMLLVTASDLAAADAEFEEEIKNNPADVVSRMQVAAADYKVNSAAGIPYAEEAVKLAPGVPLGHYLLGLLYLDTDNYQKAISELETAQKSLPKDSKLYFALGSAYSRAGRKKDAERARATFERLTKESTGAASGH